MNKLQNNKNIINMKRIISLLLIACSTLTAFADS